MVFKTLSIIFMWWDEYISKFVLKFNLEPNKTILRSNLKLLPVRPFWYFVGGHFQNMGPRELELRQLLIMRTASLNGSTMLTAQLLNILDLKSSSSQQSNFHAYKVPFWVQCANDSSALLLYRNIVVHAHTYLNRKWFICSWEVVGIFDDWKNPFCKIIRAQAKL